jgi:hypothetical protein
MIHKVALSGRAPIRIPRPWRRAANVLGIATLATTALFGTDSGAAVRDTLPTVACDKIVGQAQTGTDSGYRLVLGIVSVPPARLIQVVPTHTTPWTHWRKAGLVIRASDSPVMVSVPPDWRTRAAITWGNSGTVSALNVAPCPAPASTWNAYAGGFYIRARAACVPLTFTVGVRSQTVRFGIGRACASG